MLESLQEYAIIKKVEATAQAIVVTFVIACSAFVLALIGIGLAIWALLR